MNLKFLLIQLLGPDDPDECKKHAEFTLRANFGKDIICNAFHGSGSYSTAIEEIRLLFQETEHDNLLKYVLGALSSHTRISQVLFQQRSHRKPRSWIKTSRGKDFCASW